MSYKIHFDSLKYAKILSAANIASADIHAEALGSVDNSLGGDRRH